METKRELKVGDRVIYVDPKGILHNALVNHVWAGVDHYRSAMGEPGCNLVYITSDPSRSDSYGSQIERQTSVVHKSKQPAHGNYWCWPEE